MSVEQSLQAWRGELGTKAAEHLAREIDTMSTGSWQAIAGRSRETSTHFAYNLYDSDDEQYSVWINEYKPSAARERSYASSVHNHRYDFVTTPLTGAYRYSHYKLSDVSTIPCREMGDTLRVGDILQVSSTKIHSLDSIEDGTCTLLVKSRPRERFSTSWDLTSGESSDHWPVEERPAILAEGLRGRKL